MFKKIINPFKEVFRRNPFLGRAYLIIKAQKLLTFLRIQKPVSKLVGKKYKRSRRTLSLAVKTQPKRQSRSSLSVGRFICGRTSKNCRRING